MKEIIVIRQRLEEIKQKTKGFTLVELIVVIAIIGILSSILLPKYFGFTDDARQAAVVSEAKSIRSICEIYYANNDYWPAVSNGGASGFQIQDGGTQGSATYSTTATKFSGVLEGYSTTDGSFTYTIGSHSAICDSNGNVASTS
jgi:type IV pilus assembly protein PilA